MSDKALTEKLLSTTDAMVWAEEWCRIAREIEAADDGRTVIDEGWMVSWFANAMQTAANDHSEYERGYNDGQRDTAHALMGLAREFGEPT